MYKDEMIQLHQFLVYVLKYLDTDNSSHSQNQSRTQTCNFCSF